MSPLYRTDGTPVRLYRTDGTPVRLWDTSGRLVVDIDDPVGPLVRRGVVADVWRTGRVTQNRVPAEASTYLTAHRVRLAGSALQLTYGGNLPAGVTMDIACAVEVEGGPRVRATFAGAAVVTVTGPEQLTTEALGVTVAPGAVLRVYTYYGARSDGLNHPGSPAAWYSNEILPGDQTMSGEARTSGTYPGSTGYWAPMPHSITALCDPAQESWVLLGDSITESGSPARTPLPVGRQEAALTWAHRALTGPVCNTAMWGTSYALDRSAHWATIPDLSTFTDALVAWGYNDLDQAWANSGRDVAYVKANAVAAWSWIRAEGPRVWQATVSPSTDSTDGWASVEGQTPRASLPYRQEFNDWLRDGAPIDGVRAGEDGHPLAGVIDQAAHVESAPGSGIFRVDHGALTADGGHPNGTGHDLMAAALA